MKQNVTYHSGDNIDYSFIDISEEHKVRLREKAEDWKRIVEKYQIQINNKSVV
jgi:ABC-type phosphonate transport system ATPase subunit